MDTVASKVLMGIPPLMLCVGKESISSYKRIIHEGDRKFNGNLKGWEGKAVSQLLFMA